MASLPAESKRKVIEIRVLPRLVRMNRHIQLQDICDQLSKLAYGKPFRECLGSRQSLHVKALSNIEIKVYRPTMQLMKRKR
jgi:hypothetical protein